MRTADDVERAVKDDRALLHSGDPNLTRFLSRGGKLLVYHEWADPLAMPDASLIIYKRIEDAVRAGAHIVHLERASQRNDPERLSWIRAAAADLVTVDASSRKMSRV